MSKIIFITFLVINILRSSASQVNSKKSSTIREKYNKIVETFIKENVTISADFRMQDKDCLEELLRLKNPENEITKKFLKFDIKAILEGAAAICNEDSVKNSMENIMMRVKPFEEKFIDAYINCYKSELYKLEPTATILNGYTPNQETDNAEVCKERSRTLASDIEKKTEKLRKSTEYPQCLKAMDSFNLKVLHLKLEIITGDDITDQKVDEEALKVAEYFKFGTISTFNCIMDEINKSG